MRYSQIGRKAVGSPGSVTVASRDADSLRRSPWPLPVSSFPIKCSAANTSASPIFSDVTAEAGLSWRHFNGFSPDRYLIEAMGGGVGFFDFDNDGEMDIFLLNGGETPQGQERETGSERSVSQFGQWQICGRRSRRRV